MNIIEKYKAEAAMIKALNTVAAKDIKSAPKKVTKSTEDLSEYVISTEGIGGIAFFKFI